MLLCRMTLLNEKNGARQEPNAYALPVDPPMFNRHPCPPEAVNRMTSDKMINIFLDPFIFRDKVALWQPPCLICQSPRCSPAGFHSVPRGETL